MHGAWKWYRANGKLLQTGGFQRGVQSGVWTRYYDNGKMIDEGRFVAGKKSGLWKHYDKNGKLRRTTMHRGAGSKQ